MTEGMIIKPLCPHCGGTVPAGRHCANEQCTWYVCPSCRKVTIMKIEEV